MTVDRASLADVCRRYGGLLHGLPAGIEGARLLWAIAGNESSFGENVAPRHEVEYCPQPQWHLYLSPNVQEKYELRAGRYSADPAQQKLYRGFGCLACSSHTAWQIMAAHAPGYTPLELMSDLEKAAEAVLGFLNREIERRAPQNLAHFAAIWNGTASADYIAELKRNYDAGLPA